MTDNTDDELDGLLDERRMPHEDVAICLDLSLLAERDQAMLEVARASREHEAVSKPNPDAPMAGGGVAKAAKALKDAQAKVAEVEKIIGEKSIVLRITGVDRLEYAKFMIACPPRPKRQETFDPTKFYMFAAERTSQFVSKKDGQPKPISAEQWKRIDKTITDGEHDRIAQAVLNVNRGVGGTDVSSFGRGSGTTPVS